MASHKVPQNVEAEDKLLGPLSLKQLLFTMAGLFFAYLVYFFFAKVHPVSSIIWLPFMIFFLVLGLYQRKDQPVEVFLAAAIKYYFGNRIKIWNQDAYEERVIITVPPKIEHIYTKNFSGQDAVRRLDSLSSMMDSRGWSGKVGDWQNPQLAQSAATTTRLPVDSGAEGYNSQNISQPADVQDRNTSMVARSIDQQLSQATSSGRQHALQTLEQARTQAEIPAETLQAPVYQQYPDSIHQKVVQPVPTTQSQPVNLPVDPATPIANLPEPPIQLQDEKPAIKSDFVPTETVLQTTMPSLEKSGISQTLHTDDVSDEGRVIEVSLHDD